MRVRSRLSVAVAVAVLASVAIVVPRTGPDRAAAAVTAAQATVASAVSFTPYPTTSTDLFVYNGTGDCSDNGPGTDSRPFCTIAGAASVVQPGQTVVVEPGVYDASTTISVQGASKAPITFDAIAGASVHGTSSAPVFTISGARDVVLEGLMAIEGEDPIQVDSEASGVVIAGNTINEVAGTWGVLVTDAPGTDITGNTIRAYCSGGISVADASTGVAVENNIVQPLSGAGTSPCAPGSAISVSAGSEANSVVNYNLIDPSAGEPLYNWGGTGYTSLADFQAASGQGANDIAANPDLGTALTQPWMLLSIGGVFWFPLDADSPAIDSANADAPGELRTDQFGRPRTDDPGVSNTGAGGGYYDRGAVELEGGQDGPGPSVASSGPLTATWSLGHVPTWKSNGSSITMQEVNFGDGTPEVLTQASTVTHTYATAGLHTVHYSEMSPYSADEGNIDVFVGADYTPVTSDRILDTRNGTGTGKAVPVAANGTLTLPLPTVDGVAPTDMSAVVMNVTVTSPARNGNLTAYPGSGSAPAVSNLNFSAGHTVPNLVIVQVVDGEVSFRNNSSGTVQVIADLEGFYGPGGYGYQPGTPARVLDTRNGTGAKGPVAANGVLRLSLGGKVPKWTAAVVVNLTVTGPTRSGNLTAYPDGTPEPIASNLNFAAGETVPNLVIVPVTNGVADIANNSGGTVQLVADLEGYFTSGAPASFVPITPTRELDTRITGNGPLGAYKAISMGVTNAPVDYINPPVPVAVVDNVTVTQPAKNGNLIVYPADQSRPVISNVNFSTGETVPNLVMVKAGTNGWVSYYNNSPGQLQLIVDEYGFYMNAG